MKGLSYQEAKGSFRIKDSITLQGPQARHFESSIVDVSKITNYLDSFTLAINTVAASVTDHLKVLLPNMDDVDGQDVIVPNKQMVKLQDVTIPMLQKINLLATSESQMLEDTMHFLAYQMSTLQLARRDSALQQLHTKVSPDVKEALRLSPFAKPVLFQPDVVLRAKAQKEKDMDNSYIFHKFNAMGAAKQQARPIPVKKQKRKPKPKPKPQRQQQQRKQQTPQKKGGKGGPGKQGKRQPPKKQGF